MKFRPLQDRVLTRRIEREGKTAGGVNIPDTAKEKPREGEVFAVGSGVRGEGGKIHPLDVKASDGKRVRLAETSSTRSNAVLRLQGLPLREDQGLHSKMP